MAFKYGQIAIAAANATERKRALRAQQQQQALQQFMAGAAEIKKKQDEQKDQEDWMNVLEGYDPKTNTFKNNATRPDIAQRQMALRLEGFKRLMEQKKIELETQRLNDLNAHYEAQDALETRKLEATKGEKAEKAAKEEAERRSIMADLNRAKTDVEGPTASTQQPGPLEDPRSQMVRPMRTPQGVAYRDERADKMRAESRAEREQALRERREGRLDEQGKTREKHYQEYLDSNAAKLRVAEAKVKSEQAKAFAALKMDKYELALKTNEGLLDLNRRVNWTQDPRERDAMLKQIEQVRSDLEIKASRDAASDLGLDIYGKDAGSGVDRDSVIRKLEGALKGPDEAED